eukprot:CAMPEP_0194706970 /NCGR_PEP_ID=MMETSP0295-20121207/29879_1 /TAXON_ID=39354 /ORGANISM="Heterosigma akashiwo, Strain CCMP2393" /LENGTH=565 /DNA_ID=CAMNT_0039603015 /DNA_START=294 /DNA_END=1991 /DNA_ORIENTATION=+
MSSLKAIGFDMDYTLSRYYQEFDLLAYEGAKEKLVHTLGYPEEVLDYVYDADFFVRGLVIDKKLGNILKIDRHKYCSKAFHGFAELGSNQRKAAYQTGATMPSFTEARFVNVDTIFTLVDAVLFAQLVELKDSDPKAVRKSYEEIYTDIRHSVDMCHRDGVIKSQVAEDPGRYIIEDPGMVDMLRHLRAEGFKVFLVTNSEYEYTHVVMNFLMGNAKPEERTIRRVLLHELQAALPDGPAGPALPHRHVPARAERAGEDASAAFLAEGAVFHMGNWQHLQKILGVARGDQILYVGDHMYSDVLRTKRTLGWRTCLVVPEMEAEIETHLKAQTLSRDVKDLRNLQYDLEEYVDEVLQAQRRLRPGEDAAAAAELRARLADLEAQKGILKRILRAKADLFHYQFHPVWGQIFKAGYQDSRFAQQVSDYSCLYTSKALEPGPGLAAALLPHHLGRPAPPLPRSSSGGEGGRQVAGGPLPPPPESSDGRGRRRGVLLRSGWLTGGSAAARHRKKVEGSERRRKRGQQWEKKEDGRSLGKSSNTEASQQPHDCCHTTHCCTSSFFVCHYL